MAGTKRAIGLAMIESHPQSSSRVPGKYTTAHFKPEVKARGWLSLGYGLVRVNCNCSIHGIKLK